MGRSLCLPSPEFSILCGSGRLGCPTGGRVEVHVGWGSRRLRFHGLGPCVATDFDGGFVAWQVDSPFGLRLCEVGFYTQCHALCPQLMHA